MQVIEEKIENDVKITTLRTSAGVTVTVREHIHTPAEEQKIYDDFLIAAAKIMYPEIDINRVSKITMICN